MVLDFVMDKMEGLLGEGEETWRGGGRKASLDSTLQKVLEKSLDVFSGGEKPRGEIMRGDLGQGAGVGNPSNTFWLDNHKHT